MAFIIDLGNGPKIITGSSTYTVISAYDEQCDSQAQDSVTANFGQEPGKYC
jgi:hypothetical protein